MRTGFLGSLAVWLMGAGLALAQTDEPGPAENLPPPTVMPSEAGPAGGMLLPDTPVPAAGVSAAGVPAAGEGEEGPGPEPGCCGGGIYGPGSVGPLGNYWFRGEYLFWWTKNGRLPPLVTTGPATSAGVLGLPGTRTLLGGADLDTEEQSGGRFSYGFWLTDFHKVGLEFTYFFLGSRGVDSTVASAGDTLLGRPFVDTFTGQANSLVAAIPGVSSGHIQVVGSSRLQGADLNVLARLCCGTNYRLDLLLGFRWMELNDGLGVNQESQSLADPLSRTLINDQFDTQNRYYGGQIGLRTEYYWGRAAVSLAGKVALGSTREAINIRGATVIETSFTTPALINSGLLAEPSNIGGFDRNTFAVVPEVGVNLTYQVTQHVRAFAGYNFLYWSKVVRPGDQVDTTINLNQFGTNPPFNPLAGVARPAVPFKETDFWAHGANVGLEIRF
jgi:hypothetical protein